MQLAHVWSKFRALPLWVQIIAWVPLAPVVGALAILADNPRGKMRLASAATVLFLFGPLWVILYTTSGEPPVPAVDAVAAEDLAEDVADEPDENPSPPPKPKPSPKPTPSPSPSPSPPPEVVVAAWTVTNIVDGDTLDVESADGTEERVRIVGIDTPERGECGYEDAAAALGALVMGKSVVLVAGASDDQDRYDRRLRYVDVGTTDAGLSLVEQGLAIARYDSRDGYGRHAREAAYVAADAAADNVTCAAPAPPPPAPEPEPQPESVYYKNCDAARADGAAPVRRGDPGYHHHLDRDGDGSGCE